MTLNEYQEKAMGTCLPTCENFSYMMLNLVGEVGELAGKVAKAIRKEEIGMYDNNLHAQIQIHFRILLCFFRQTFYNK